MEHSLSEILWRLAAVMALVFANGFFVAAEFAIIAVRKTRIDQLIAEGNKRAVAVRRAVTDPDSYIAATQLGITMASLGLGWIGEPALAELVSPAVTFLPTGIAEATAHTISVADIIGAIEDETDTRSKDAPRETSASAQEMTQDLWDALQSTVVAYLKTVTLQSLAQEQKAKGFQVEERKTVQKGVYQKPRPPVARPGTPNSVFALGQVWPGRA